MTNFTPRELRELSVRIAGEASGFLRDLREDDEQAIETVSGETIKADVEAEQYILELLKAEGFSGLVVTEERGVVELGKDNMIALIDPLDGSTNYKVGIPWCSVSIGFSLKRRGAKLRDVIAGAVYPVYEGYPYSFYKGGGVYFGEVKIDKNTSNQYFESFGKTIMTVYEDDPEAIEFIKEIYKYLESKFGSIKIRSLGSAALELALTAMGRIGYFVDLRAKLRVTDVAVGFGMIRESGGVYTDESGREINNGIERLERVKSIVGVFNKKDLQEILDALKRTRI